MNISTKEICNKILTIAICLMALNLSFAQDLTISGNLLVRDTTIPIHNVSVIISGDQNEEVITDENGYYEFQVASAGNYTITPKNNTQVRCGLTTLDIVIISRHITNDDPFTSPFQFIAADINNDQIVDSMDIVELESMILLQQDTFVNNTSWRFVAADYTFAGIDPFPATLAETKEFINITNDQLNVNFVGTKVGDMQVNAPCISIINSTSSISNLENKLLIVPNPVDSYSKISLTGQIVNQTR